MPRLEFSTMTEEIRKMNSAGPRTKDTVHKIFKRAEKLINLETPDQAKLEALMDRLTRRGIEITRMDKKSALSFQDKISYWQFKIAHLLKSKQDIPVSQFQNSNSKQTPTVRMHVNLPKLNIKSFGGYPP